MGVSRCAAHKSGRRSRVIFSASARRHAATSRMVARQQHIRHTPPVPLGGPCIVRVFQQPPRETLLLGARRRPHHPGQQPHHASSNTSAAGSPAGKHVVADADLLQRPGLDHPLVHALVPPAQQHHARPRPPAPRTPPASSRRPRGVRYTHGRPSLTPRQSRVEHVRPHHHARPATERRIVHGPVPIGRKGANIHAPPTPTAPPPTPARPKTAPTAPETSPETASERMRASSFRRRLRCISVAASATTTSAGGTTVTRPPATSTTGTQARVNGTSNRPISRLAPPP